MCCFPQVGECVSEPEAANDLRQCLIGKRSHCRGLEHVFARR